MAATFYGPSLLAASVVLAVLWRHAVSADLVRADAADDQVAMLTRKLTPALAF